MKSLLNRSLVLLGDENAVVPPPGDHDWLMSLCDLVE